MQWRELSGTALEREGSYRMPPFPAEGNKGEGATEETEGNTGEAMQKGKAKAPTHKQRRPAPQDQSSTCPTATGRSTKALLRV